MITGYIPFFFIPHTLYYSFSTSLLKVFPAYKIIKGPPFTSNLIGLTEQKDAYIKNIYDSMTGVELMR